MDPLAALPTELALKILECLSFRSIVAAQRISKSWLNFVRSESSLWHHLDLTRARRDFPTQFTVDTAIRVAAKEITAITLYGDRMRDQDETFEKVAQSCPLEKVALMQTGVINEDRQLALTLRDLRGPLRELRMHALNSHPVKLRSLYIEPHIDTLELLDIDGYQVMSDHFLTNSTFPRLHTLRVAAKGQQGSGVVGIGSKAHRYTVLRSLEISNIDKRRNPSAFSGFTNLTRLDLRHHVISMRALKLPPSLKTLRLDAQVSITADESQEGELRFDLPHLECLELSLIGITLKDIDKFLCAAPGREGEASSKGSNLTTLLLSHLEESSWADVPVPFTHPRLQRLRNLRIHDTVSLEDARLQMVVDQLKHLQWLDVCRSSITDAGVRYVVEHSGVKMLHLRSCESVGDEIVEWTRGQGVNVGR
ncbi:hypothetical protein CLAFUW7_07890 [Fulvia fulva]|nr:hypothetical protein CLAFUW7_07890 [Fulvia fulva]